VTTHRNLAPAPPEASRASVAWGTADREQAILDSSDGGGAELRGSVPADPEAVVVILHGGAERSRSPVSWWRLPVVRMVPFASAVERRAGDRLAVLRLKYRVRGWNDPSADPVVDTRWALDRIRRVLPGVPIALVGHSMGGRVALHLAADPDVAAVVALAPWVENDVGQPRPGTHVLLMHGTRDRITDPRRTQVIARWFAEAGVAVRHIRVEGESHAMLRHAREWHEMVAHFLVGALLGRRRAS
jgi:alpha-beta hydrolase superfamily lysophospholipase